MSGNYKRLYRSKDERMISGVCGGLGKYFNVDPTLIRLLFVIAAAAGGPGLIAYIILAIVVPEEPESSVAPPPSSPETDEVEEVEAGEEA
jgi:phage shock protein C